MTIHILMYFVEYERRKSDRLNRIKITHIRSFFSMYSEAVYIGSCSPYDPPRPALMSNLFSMATSGHFLIIHLYNILGIANIFRGMPAYQNSQRDKHECRVTDIKICLSLHQRRVTITGEFNKTKQ